MENPVKVGYCKLLATPFCEFHFLGLQRLRQRMKFGKKVLMEENVIEDIDMSLLGQLSIVVSRSTAS